MTQPRKPLRTLAGVAFVLIALVGATLFALRPDRPVPHIAPGSSSGPTFVAQIIRPRVGLPLGGLLPPRFFGVDAELTFDSSSSGAVGIARGPRSVELASDNWEVALVADADGGLYAVSHVVFELLFEGRVRRVRCTVIRGTGELRTTELPGGELAGHFQVELEACVDASTGDPLDWPPAPLVLRGSFDRLLIEPGASVR